MAEMEVVAGLVPLSAYREDLLCSLAGGFWRSLTPFDGLCPVGASSCLCLHLHVVVSVGTSG